MGGLGGVSDAPSVLRDAHFHAWTRAGRLVRARLPASQRSSRRYPQRPSALSPLEGHRQVPPYVTVLVERAKL
jgi:hypothetical protein